jgi:hypothetical protein
MAGYILSGSSRLAPTSRLPRDYMTCDGALRAESAECMLIGFGWEVWHEPTSTGHC